MKKSYVVLMKTILGLEPVAVYSNFDSADSYTECACSDDEDPTQKYEIREFFTNADPDEADLARSGEVTYYDDEDDYDGDDD